MTDAAQTMPEKQPFLKSVDIISGSVIAFIHIVFTISLASLIFSGDLAEYLPRGIAIVLMTGAVITLMMSLLSTMDSMIATVQDDPAVILTVTISAFAPALIDSDNLLATTVVFIALTSLLTGAAIWLLGRFKLGGLVRYIPYPVIGGILAGTGWLLLRGSIGTMADYPLTVSTLPELFQPAQLIRWFPGAILGLALFFGVRRIRHFLTLPLILVAGFVLFYMGLVVAGLSPTDAQEMGLLLGGGGDSAFVNPLPYADIAHVDWNVILQNVGSIAVIVAITTTTLLLNISGTELSLQTDVDLNAELRSAGISNMVSGALGGMIGFHALTSIVLNHKAGARGRQASLVIVAITLALLFLGAGIIALLPKVLVGGILFFLGMDFLDEWFVQSWHRFSRLDFAAVLIILVVIATWGVVFGVVAGLVIMVFSFAYKYSQIDIFHRQLSGAETTSNFQRNAHHQRALTKLGQHITVFELEGYLFFGTATKLLQHIRDRLAQENTASLQYLVLDFQRVSGIDSSTAFSFSKIKLLAQKQGFKVLLCHANDITWQELVRNGLDTDDNILRYDDLNQALEWCEDELLDNNAVTAMHLPVTITLQLQDMGFSKAHTKELKQYLERLDFKDGEHLIRHGEDAHDLYFIERGLVSIYLKEDDGSMIRIRKRSLGTVVGEISFFLNQTRSASVIADIPTTAYRMTRDAHQRLQAEDPQLALEFDQLMIRIVSERLANTNRVLAAMSR